VSNLSFVGNISHIGTKAVNIFKDSVGLVGRANPSVGTASNIKLYLE